jgi:Enoyl-CoA hydratase/isomerase
MGDDLFPAAGDQSPPGGAASAQVGAEPAMVFQPARRPGSNRGGPFGEQQGFDHFGNGVPHKLELDAVGSVKPHGMHARFRREDGILEVTLHTGNEDLVWGFGPHEECGYLFEDIARDAENKVVILTGSGNTFIHKEDLGGVVVTPEGWAKVHFDAKRLLMSHLDIEVPMIAAINGPATVHAELGLLCDITLAA